MYLSHSCPQRHLRSLPLSCIALLYNTSCASTLPPRLLHIQVSMESGKMMQIVVPKGGILGTAGVGGLSVDLTQAGVAPHNYVCTNALLDALRKKEGHGDGCYVGSKRFSVPSAFFQPPSFFPPPFPSLPSLLLSVSGLHACVRYLCIITQSSHTSTHRSPAHTWHAI